MTDRILSPHMPEFSALMKALCIDIKNVTRIQITAEVGMPVTVTITTIAIVPATEDINRVSEYMKTFNLVEVTKEEANENAKRILRS